MSTSAGPLVPLAVVSALLLALASCSALRPGRGAERRHADENVEVTWTSPVTLDDGSTVIREVRVDPVLPGTIAKVELHGFVDLDGDGAADPGRAETSNVVRPFTRGSVEFGDIRVAATEGVRFFVLVELLQGREAKVELK
jgi:hypothetical protein